MDQEKIVTVAEAAKHGKVHPASVYAAIRTGQLSAKRVHRRYEINLKDYDNYRLNRYNPLKRQKNGAPVFDIDAGRYTLKCAALILSEYFKKQWSTHRLRYYIVNQKRLNATMAANCWVIRREDLQDFAAWWARDGQMELALQIV